MRKKFSPWFAAMLCAFLLLSAVCTAAPPLSTTASPSPLPEDDFASSIAEMKRQAHAEAAFETLIASFSSPTGDIRYPADFGGTWIDDTVLVISLCSFENLGSYQELLSGYERHVKFVPAESSLNQLQTVSRPVFPWLKDQVDITCYYVDQTTSKVVYEILSDVEEARAVLLRQLHLQRSKINPDLIVFQPGAMITEE